MSEKLGKNVTFTDKGIGDIFKASEQIAVMDVIVGYVGSAGSEAHPEAGISVATLAAMQEFGTDNNPARSFMRSTMMDQQQRIAEIWAEQMVEIYISDKDPISAYADIGKQVSRLILNKFDRAKGWATALDSKTVDEKGSNTPLVDSGKLRKNLGWAVTKSGVIVKEGKAA